MCRVISDGYIRSVKRQAQQCYKIFHASEEECNWDGYHLFDTFPTKTKGKVFNVTSRPSSFQKVHHSNKHNLCDLIFPKKNV